MNIFRNTPLSKMKRRTNKSIRSFLETLYQDNFFSSPKTPSDITAELGSRGFNFPTSNLNVALLRAVKDGQFLSRKRVSGKWSYIQKYPASSPSGQRTILFAKYDLHESIKQVAFKQFEDGYFKEAIQNAFVEVIDQVKIKSGRPKNTNNRELDGDDLMNHVFGCDNQTPVICFNNLETGLDRAEQRGIMNLFKGIVGIRDKKAHLNFIQPDPLKTIEYLSLASLLMRLLDEHPSQSKIMRKK